MQTEHLGLWKVSITIITGYDVCWCSEVEKETQENNFQKLKLSNKGSLCVLYEMASVHGKIKFS